MKVILRFFCFELILLTSGHLLGQRQNDTWYFCEKLGLKFSNGTSVFYPGNNKNLRYAACISDKGTGELLFYTDGYRVWGNDNLPIAGGNLIHSTAAFDYAKAVNIVPMPGSTSKYYIFYNHDDITGSPPADQGVYYAIVDMAGAGGKGEVVEKEKLICRDDPYLLHVIKHSFEDSYWLISHTSSLEFNVYKITGSGVSATPVVSGPFAGITATADMAVQTTSNDGKQIVLGGMGGAYVLDFDKTCGQLSNPVKLAVGRPKWYPVWSVFSPDNTRLYVMYTEMQSPANNPILAQYHGDGFVNYDTLKTDTINQWQDARLGPDNRIYISDVPSRLDFIYRVHVINAPDSAIDSCMLEGDKYRIPADDIDFFMFPRFILDRGIPDTPRLAVDILGGCLGHATTFNIRPPFIPDEIEWNFGDVNSSSNTSSQLNPSHVYTDTGKYTVTVKWKKCGSAVAQNINVFIHNFKELSIGRDSVLCYKDTLLLSASIPNARYTWSTGDTTRSIVATQPGLYWLTAASGLCKATDSVKITGLPPILVEIGNGYSVCENDTSTLVKLDAGKGYVHYKWTPTGDTSQWILVRQAGDYYVVVENYLGCKGDDGTKIIRRCNFDFYVPNAFTPNGDGLNDLFLPLATDVIDYSLEIYNRWGQRIYASGDPISGWNGIYDGKPCPEGIYMFSINFKGYLGAVLKNYSHTGQVTLIR